MNSLEKWITLNIEICNKNFFVDYKNIFYLLLNKFKFLLFSVLNNQIFLINSVSNGKKYYLQKIN